ncbi:DUF1571 domain-containing protein [Planctomicrobium sp. SH661]|uniref:DUF1571 domain-containing protein n=1 Tax=Planctomicrobium sp. SH661 TaxID=3448124 RepID=UPI003F5CB1FD
MRRSQRSASPFGRNFLALLVAGGAFSIAQLNLDPFNFGGLQGSHSTATAAAPRLGPPPPELPVPIPSGADAKDHTAAKPQSQDDAAILRGIWAVKMASALLEKGCENFAKVPDYTANMLKQERIGGALGICQVIDVKIRHEPFSVYMKWSEGDRGRQLIYVDGQNDGNMLVQPGGIKGRLTGVLSLEPTGSLAMSDSRYSITKAGLLELARSVLTYQKQDLQRGKGFTCQLFDQQEFEGRQCYLYLIEYEAPEFNDLYRKSMVYVDKELSLPICVKNFTWGKDVDPEKMDEETLIEFYAYTDLKFEQNLNAADFDKNNSEYRLRVRQ